MPDRPSHQPRPTIPTPALFALLAVIWGSSFLLIEIALEAGVAPLTLAGLRTLVGAALLALIALLSGWARPADADAWRRLTILAMTNMAVPFVLIIWGQQSITSGMAAILNALVPLFALAIAVGVLRDERLTVSKLVGLLVGFLGVVLLAAPSLGAAADGAGGRAAVAGMAAVAIASFIYGIGVVYARRQLGDAPRMRYRDGTERPADVLQLTLWQVVISALSLVIVALAVERPTAGLIGLPASTAGWLAIAWLGLLGTGVAYLLFFRIVRAWGSTRTSLITYAIPPIAIVLGIVVLDERLLPIELAGSALIIAGILIVNVGPRRRLLAARSSA